MSAWGYRRRVVLEIGHSSPEKRDHVGIVDDFSIQHPAEKVWPYLTVPEKWLEFIPALVERTRIDTGPVEPGAEWKSVDRIGPRKVEFTDLLAEIEPETRVVWLQS